MVRIPFRAHNDTTMKGIQFISILILLFAAASCREQSESGFSLQKEMYSLENGMNVVLQRDTTDPFVAVSVHYNAGESFEKESEKGIGRLVHSLMLDRSDHVEPGVFSETVQLLGGAYGGEVTTDGILFYEVAPVNALSRLLWMEADRMGHMSEAIDEISLSAHRKKVIEEIVNQTYRRSYGLTDEVIRRELFPEDHSLNYLTAEVIDNLSSVTPDEVRTCHERYFAPGNATLVLSGAFDPSEVKQVIKAYFGSISSNGADPPTRPGPAVLTSTRKLYHEEPDARISYLTLAWPAPGLGHEKVPEMKCLAGLLGNGSASWLQKKIVDEEKLASRVLAMYEPGAGNGRFSLIITPRPNISMGDVEKATLQALEAFNRNYPDEYEIRRVLSEVEINFYKGIRSIFGRSQRLARYAGATGDPLAMQKEIDGLVNVTGKGVRKAFNEFIHEKPFVLTAFVPSGSGSLVPPDAEKAETGQDVPMPEFPETESAKAEAAQTTMNTRGSEAPEATAYPLPYPLNTWRKKYDSGMEVIACENHELPWVNFTLEIEGGHLAEDTSKAGTVHLLVDLLKQGPADIPVEEYATRLERMGSSVTIRPGLESISIQVSCLTRYLEETAHMVLRTLMDPEWNEEELARSQLRIRSYLERSRTDPTFLAFKTFNEILFDKNSIMGIPSLGTLRTISTITMDDLKHMYRRHVTPSATTLLISGNVSEALVKKAFAPLIAGWGEGQDPSETVSVETVKKYAGEQVIPLKDATRSLIIAGKPWYPRDYAEITLIEFANHTLHNRGGGFLNDFFSAERDVELIASSGFNINRSHALFLVSAAIKNGSPEDAVLTLRKALSAFPSEISEDQFEQARDEFNREKFGPHETLESIQNLLVEMNRYGMDNDFLAGSAQELRNLSYKRYVDMAATLTEPDSLLYVIVDAQ